MPGLQLSSRIQGLFILKIKHNLSHDVASGSGITPCNLIDKPSMVYNFSLITKMTPIIMFRKRSQNLDVFRQKMRFLSYFNVM